VITRTPSQTRSQTPTLEHRYNRKDNKTEKQSIQTTSLPFSSMEWRPGRSWCTITMTHVNSSVMLFVDGKALSVQNLAKKSVIAFPRSVATGLIGGKGFVGHLGPISLFRGVRGVRAREFQSFHFFMFQSFHFFTFSCFNHFTFSCFNHFTFSCFNHFTFSCFNHFTLSCSNYIAQITRISYSYFSLISGRKSLENQRSNITVSYMTNT
jgi:hypothetical protein